MADSDDLDPTDPFEAFLTAAPDDDEPFTEEDRAAADAGWRAYLRGEASSLDEVRRRLLGDVDEPEAPGARRAAG